MWPKMLRLCALLRLPLMNMQPMSIHRVSLPVNLFFLGNDIRNGCIAIKTTSCLVRLSELFGVVGCAFITLPACSILSYLYVLIRGMVCSFRGAPF